MAVIGLPTTHGLNQSIVAAANKGYFINPVRFGVSDIAGPWDSSRLPSINPPCWFSAQMSDFRRVGEGAIEFICTIPPGSATITRQIREIQIFCQDTSGQEFFFAFGQPGDPPNNVVPLYYLPSDYLRIRLQIIISPLSIGEVFEFKYSQAQEIAEHNLAQNAHPRLLELLSEHGIFMFFSDNKFGGQWVDVFPSLSSGCQDGMWVYLDNDGKYYPAMADRTKRQKAPGLLDTTHIRGPRVLYGGLQTYSADLPVGATLYLSANVVGEAGEARSPRPLGISLGNQKYLISSGVGSGSNANHVAVFGNYLAGQDDYVHVYFPTDTNTINITLPAAPLSTGETITVLDTEQKTDIASKKIIVKGNGKGIDSTTSGQSDDFSIDVPGAIVTFVYDNEIQSWSIDIGGRTSPYTHKIDVYHWAFLGNGGITYNIPENFLSPPLPRDSNPYHFLVQVEDEFINPKDYYISYTNKQITFNAPVAIGDDIVIRWIGSGSSLDGCPIGMISHFLKSGGKKAGWLVCNGDSFDPVLLPDLFAALGEDVLPNIATAPDSNIFYQIKAYDNIIATGSMDVSPLLSAIAEIGNIFYVGSIHTFNLVSPPENWKVCDGSVLSNVTSDYLELKTALTSDPKLAAYVVDETTWQNMSTANDWNGIGGVPRFVYNSTTNTIRLPDLRGMFPEIAGFSGVNPGTVQRDAIRNITGYFDIGMDGGYRGVSWEIGGAFYQTGNRRIIFGEGVWDYEQAYLKNFDASRVVPTANVNRPRSWGVLACVKVK